jgi:D-glycero-alpha-D-manno-heptose-7-phosphate kinase
VFRASAPVRLDFAGAWTDVAPFAERERGVVVNAAIELRARAEVALGGETWRLRSEDLGESAELCSREALAPDGRLDLLKAGLRRSGLGPCALRTWSEAPPGSGLGSSGALDVALVAALDAARGTRRVPVEVAEEAFRLEAVEAALPGGKQDQYAAALGGFNRLVFEGGTVSVEPLPLDPAFVAELGRRIVVCYTGTSRVSSKTIARVMGAYGRGVAEVTEALRALAEVAERMAGALLAGDLPRMAGLLTENWRHQQRLDRGMCTGEMARLEAAMRATGALGGKAAGAGAGGSMFFIAGDDPRRAARAAREAGARVLPFAWAARGVTVEAGA